MVCVLLQIQAWLLCSSQSLSLVTVPTYFPPFGSWTTAFSVFYFTFNFFDVREQKNLVIATLLGAAMSAEWRRLNE